MFNNIFAKGKKQPHTKTLYEISKIDLKGKYTQFIHSYKIFICQKNRMINASGKNHQYNMFSYTFSTYNLNMDNRNNNGIIVCQNCGLYSNSVYTNFGYNLKDFY